MVVYDPSPEPKESHSRESTSTSDPTLHTDIIPSYPITLGSSAEPSPSSAKLSSSDPPVYTFSNHSESEIPALVDERRRGGPPPPPQPSSSSANYPYAILNPVQQYAQSSLTSFSRQPPQQRYPPFEPTFLIASGQHLSRGFPELPPPSRMNRHPFATHDVTESDWLKFLQEVKAAGGLTEKQESLARIPIVSSIPVVGTLSTHLIRQQMKKGKDKDVCNVIDQWNHHFFHPRYITAILMCGMTRLSGVERQRLYSQSMKPIYSVEDLLRPILEATPPGKGKGKDTEDTTYRLFIMPLISD